MINSFISGTLWTGAPPAASFIARGCRNDSRMTIAASDCPTRQQLIESHIGLAKALARRKYRNSPHNLVRLDDLESDAMLGLVQAANSFDASKGNLFRTYAGHRINGAMLDGLRKRNQTRRQCRPKRAVSLDQRVRGRFGGDLAVSDLVVSREPPVGHALELREEAHNVMRHLVHRGNPGFDDTKAIHQCHLAAQLGLSSSAMSQRVQRAQELYAEINHG